MNDAGNARLVRPRQREAGVAIIVVLSIIIALTLIAALAVDIGKVMAVKSQLQSAADSAALAGAGKFTDITTYADNGVTAAAQANLEKNQFLNTYLKDATFTIQQWNLDTSRPYAAGDSAYARLVPSLRVTISLSGNQNFGGLPMSFAGFFGFNRMNLTVTATAMKSPSIAAIGSLLPIAINSCIYDLKWDSVQQKPKSTTPFMIYSALVMSQPNITNDLVKCTSGQWTTLDLVNNSATAVQQLLATGNTRPFYTMDDVYIQPGDKTSVYDDINAATAGGQTIAGYLPVTNGDLTTKGFLDAVRFVPFAITAGQKKDVAGGVAYSYVSGRMLTLEEAEVMIPESKTRDTMTMAPRLVQ